MEAKGPFSWLGLNVRIKRAHLIDTNKFLIRLAHIKRRALLLLTPLNVYPFWHVRIYTEFCTNRSR